MTSRIRTVALITAAIGLAGTISASTAAAYGGQTINLSAATGDGHSSGTASLTVRKSHGGYAITGTLTAETGCVELKAKTRHWFEPDGINTIAKVCGNNRSQAIHSWTGRNEIVLSADVSMNHFDSTSVQLTGTPDGDYPR